MTKREQNKLDKQIEQLYYRHGNGVQIDIMNINKLFSFCRQAAEVGTPLEQAVVAAIAIYRED